MTASVEAFKAQLSNAADRLDSTRDAYHAAKKWATAEELEALRAAYHEARESYGQVRAAYEWQTA